MKIKKYIQALFFICLTLVIAKSGFSQITVDAGKDTTYCAGLSPDTMYLGTNIYIINAVEPYSYRWECKVELSPTLIFTASDYLNDTTIATPYYKDWLTDTEKVKFFVFVTDNEGNSAMDSINIGFSGCTCLTGTIVVEINKGDSVWLDAGSDSHGKYKKSFWEPKYGLTHPDSSATWCKPKVKTSYSLVQIDTFGCTCSCPVYEIRIISTKVNEFNSKKDNLLEIRQDGTEIYFNNPLKKEAHITLYSINGIKKHNLKIADDYFELAGLLKKKGIYIVKISVGELTDSSKIINL